MTRFAKLGARWVLAVTLFGALAPVVTQEAAAEEVTRPGGSSGNKPVKKPAKKPGKKPGKGKDNKHPGKGPFKKSEYPLAERGRPLVLPDHMGQVTVLPEFDHLSFGGDSVDTFGTGVAFDYGLADIVEIGVGTGLVFAPDFDWSHTLYAQVHWLAWDSKDFDFAPGVVVPFTFYEDASFGANIDLTSRYVVADKFFLKFGQGAIGMVASPDFGLSINGNGSVNWQVDKPILLWLDTTVFSFLLAPDVDITGPWETLNVGIGGQYTASRMIDVGLRLGYVDSWQVKEESDINVLLYGRFRF